ncbi:MAG: FISUMP domain-containing protein [Bacteroidales bacterium]|nr:FISUMP domain-containing protein [Bacteroidales bacterium]
MKRAIILIMVSFVIFGCERNQKPEILQITCSPETGKAGTVFSLDVLASDPDGTALTYMWSAEEGTFSPTPNTKMVKWTSPVTGGGKTYSLSVTASDGKAETSRQIQVALGEPGIGAVEGHIYYTNFNIPIAGVTVKLADKTTNTDETGYFILTDVTENTYKLTAGKESFGTFTSTIKIIPNDTLTITGEMTSVNFTTKLSGFVLDQDENPLEDAEITVLYMNGYISDLKTTSDKDGSYRLWYIPFGDWKLSVTKEQTLDYYYYYEAEKLQLNEIQIEKDLVLKKLSLTKEFTDPRDNHVYHYRYIPHRTWMVENLAYLPEVYPPDSVSTLKALYYVYDYAGTDTAAAAATENYKEYGVLYNGPAAKTACPPGWELPGQHDMDNISYYYKEEPSGTILKSVSGWSLHGNGTNLTRFNALPAGKITVEGAFSSIHEATYFWTSYDVAFMTPLLYGLFYNDVYVNDIRGSVKMGASIRCVKKWGSESL